MEFLWLIKKTLQSWSSCSGTNNMKITRCHAQWNVPHIFSMLVKSAIHRLGVYAAGLKVVAEGSFGGWELGNLASVTFPGCGTTQKSCTHISTFLISKEQELQDVLRMWKQHFPTRVVCPPPLKKWRRNPVIPVTDCSHTLSPGQWEYQELKSWECWAATPAAGPLGPRKVMGTGTYVDTHYIMTMWACG